MNDDAFAVLGLPTRPGLSDDDVRAAWRRIAAATHPDREDGGDPARFGAAAAAYAILRTDYGRGEALADLGLSGTADAPAGPGRHRVRQEASAGRRAGQAEPSQGPPWAAGPSGRQAPVEPQAQRNPRSGGLALRVAGAAGVGVVAVVLSGWSPGLVGLLAGVLTWLLVLAGRALARRRSP